MIAPILFATQLGKKPFFFFFDAVKCRNKPDNWYCTSAELMLVSCCAASGIFPTASFSSLLYASSLWSFNISSSKPFLVLSWKLAL